MSKIIKNDEEEEDPTKKDELEAELEDQVKAIEKEEKKPKKESDFPFKKYIGKYWSTSVHITGYGTVNGGKATEEQLKAFAAVMGPDTNLDDWLSDKDVYTEYVKKNTTKTGTT